MAVYSLYLTNAFGFKLKRAKTETEKKQLRCEYSDLILSRLNIEVVVLGLDKVESDKQYLLLSNHRSIIDPCIIEMALKDTNIYGLWISKKELYFSLFFGMFVRNGGSVLLDRSSNKMGKFFKAIKEGMRTGASIFIFPEGTRNKENTDLAEFKDGTQLIAIKNKLPMLPVYIRTNANEILHTAINKRQKGLRIEVEIGDTIEYGDRSVSLETAYRNMFKNKQGLCLV